jgi:hypothetical protein
MTILNLPGTKPNNGIKSRHVHNPLDHLESERIVKGRTIKCDDSWRGNLLISLWVIEIQSRSESEVDLLDWSML